ncbi:hypothetical protein M407DRAFT_22482 [Tulasnella calospora MUT 4182]|uniref:Uncharacterized protein n=1 Tax=Tulasnella calospora MUT 4182 TaxID=1051891 RepID=A0A0C3M3M4_9AGAM|nr:hypothetical protein M407DRAFT_22482 [Tulasnella calospora MUT 4182]
MSSLSQSVWRQWVHFGTESKQGPDPINVEVRKMPKCEAFSKVVEARIPEFTYHTSHVESCRFCLQRLPKKFREPPKNQSGPFELVFFHEIIVNYAGLSFLVRRVLPSLARAASATPIRSASVIVSPAVVEKKPGEDRLSTGGRATGNPDTSPLAVRAIYGRTDLIFHQR